MRMVYKVYLVLISKLRAFPPKKEFHTICNSYSSPQIFLYVSTSQLYVKPLQNFKGKLDMSLEALFIGKLFYWKCLDTGDDMNLGLKQMRV